jgi:hypothetical protein
MVDGSLAVGGVDSTLTVVVVENVVDVEVVVAVSSRPP